MGLARVLREAANSSSCCYGQLEAVVQTDRPQPALVVRGWALVRNWINPNLLKRSNIDQRSLLLNQHTGAV